MLVCRQGGAFKSSKSAVRMHGCWADHKHVENEVSERGLVKSGECQLIQSYPSIQKHAAHETVAAIQNMGVQPRKSWKSKSNESMSLMLTTSPGRFPNPARHMTAMKGKNVLTGL